MRKVAFLLLLPLFLLIGCAVKPPMISLYEALLTKGLEGRILKGKVYVEGDFSKLFDIPSSGAYGEFYLLQAYFLLRISPPFGDEVLFEWDEKRGPRVILPSKAKVYYPKEERLQLKDLPYYFLGLKETSREFYLNSFKGEYAFDRQKLEGRVNSLLFSLTWRIKELEETPSLPPPIDTTGFKRKKINLPF